MKLMVVEKYLKWICIFQAYNERTFMRKHDGGKDMSEGSIKTSKYIRRNFQAILSDTMKNKAVRKYLFYTRPLKGYLISKNKYYEK